MSSLRALGALTFFTLFQLSHFFHLTESGNVLGCDPSSLESPALYPHNTNKPSFIQHLEWINYFNLQFNLADGGVLGRCLHMRVKPQQRNTGFNPARYLLCRIALNDNQQPTTSNNNNNNQESTPSGRGKEKALAEQESISRPKQQPTLWGPFYPHILRQHQHGFLAPLPSFQTLASACEQKFKDNLTIKADKASPFLYEHREKWRMTTHCFKISSGVENHYNAKRRVYQERYQRICRIHYVRGTPIWGLIRDKLPFTVNEQELPDIQQAEDLIEVERKYTAQQIQELNKKYEDWLLIEEAKRASVLTMKRQVENERCENKGRRVELTHLERIQQHRQSVHKKRAKQLQRLRLHSQRLDERIGKVKTSLHSQPTRVQLETEQAAVTPSETAPASAAVDSTSKDKPSSSSNPKAASSSSQVTTAPAPAPAPAAVATTPAVSKQNDKGKKVSHKVSSAATDDDEPEEQQLTRRRRNT